MVLDGLRGYLQLANGLTEVTRERALAAARSLVTQGEAAMPAPVRTQVTALTEELLTTSKVNRELLSKLVRGEVERSVSRLGLVSAQELDAAARREKGLERRVAELEDELRKSTTARKAASTRAKKATAKKSTAKKSAAKRSAAKKSTAKKSTARRSSAGEPTPTGSTASASTASGSTASEPTPSEPTATASTATESAADASTTNGSTSGGTGEGTTA